MDGKVATKMYIYLCIMEMVQKYAIAKNCEIVIQAFKVNISNCLYF